MEQDLTLPPQYAGRILTGTFSEELKSRVRNCILSAQACEGRSVVIPYISAWMESERVLWYEYAGPRLMDLLACSAGTVADAFRAHLIDRRSYRYFPAPREVREEVIPKGELGSLQKGLREEVKKSGTIEAVYKLGLKDGRILWLKDWAILEAFSADGVNVSFGTLTDVTKEMDHKEILEQIGYFDELTRLPKRNILYRILEVNIGQMQRRHLENFVFLMIDVDHFKSINDAVGHQGGDHVLTTLADVMNSIKRKEDEIGRYGGEEFYAVGHGSLENGRVFAERLRQHIETAEILYEGQKVPVTVSIGLAAASELPELSMQNIITLADRRLYLAKQQGRNRVVWEGGLGKDGI